MPLFVDLLAALKALTGLDSFRIGQEETIRRILAGKSTLLVLPTGAGKSLCYQLSTFVLRNCPNSSRAIALVISPMLSLINDQLRCLPAALHGAALSSGPEKVCLYYLGQLIKGHPGKNRSE